MKQLVTSAIVLSRTDYGEADRILTLLTPDFGKLSVLARGVRRVKSKLAGGIELFSVSEITFIKGRGEVGTLISTRLVRHYGTIITSLDRTMTGYDLIKQLTKITEDQPEEAYFRLLVQVFEALDDQAVGLPLIRFWFHAELLRLNGYTPNLQMDGQGSKLRVDQSYTFDFDHSAFMESQSGLITAAHIKFLRLAFAGNSPKLLAQVQGAEGLLRGVEPLVMAWYRHSL